MPFQVKDLHFTRTTSRNGSNANQSAAGATANSRTKLNPSVYSRWVIATELITQNVHNMRARIKRTPGAIGLLWIALPAGRGHASLS